PGDEFPSEIGDAIMEKVMTKDDLGISSSFGLQNCYCDRCRPENTVGKIYNGSCYYVSTDNGHRFRVIEGNRDRLVRWRYTPAIIGGLDIGTVFKQVSNEYYLKNFEFEIGFYVQDEVPPRRVLRPLESEPLANKCLVYDVQAGKIIKDCTRPYVIFMKAERSTYFLLPKFQAQPYDPCPFDAEAMSMVGRQKYCVKASTKRCELHTANIYPRNFENLHKYLTTITQPNANNLSDINSAYRIAGFHMKRFSQLDYLVRLEKRKDVCTFIDAQSKQVSSMSCSTSPKRLCEIKRPTSAASVLRRSSRYGMRNCICHECQHDVTIGKLYNGTCYFSSIDRNYMFPTTSENLNGTIAYRPAVISDNAGVRILQQVAFELSDALDVKKLGLYAQRDFNLSDAFVPKPSTKPSKDDCLVYNVFYNKLIGDCSKPYSVLLGANESNSILYDEYVPAPYLSCTFDEDAVSVPGNYCLKLSETPCEKLTDRMFDDTIFGDENILPYLIAKTQARASDLGYLKLVVKYDSVNSDRHSELCSYFDLQSKLEISERCDLPVSLNLCVVEDNRNSTALPPTTAETTTSTTSTTPGTTTSTTPGTTINSTVPKSDPHKETRQDGETLFMVYIGGVCIGCLLLLFAIYAVIKCCERRNVPGTIE
ncbi:MAG: hypothetical protein ABW185_18905, partial [Sedimenticola sp.]